MNFLRPELPSHLLQHPIRALHHLRHVLFRVRRGEERASSCDGGRYTPSPSMRWKKRANFSRLERLALSKSVTGASAKKIVHIEPTRFITIGTLCLSAAASTPFSNSAPR